MKDQLATKQDLHTFRSEIQSLRTELRGDIKRLCLAVESLDDRVHENFMSIKFAMVWVAVIVVSGLMAYVLK